MTQPATMTVSPGSRLHWLFADGWTVTRRFLIHLARQPAQLAAFVAFPIMMVLMFAYLFGGAMAVPDGAGYPEFLIPGMFAMTMLFGMSATMTAVRTDLLTGITDRFRSLPMSASAVLVGRTVTDLLISVVALAAIAGCGLLIGWRSNAGFGPTLAAFGLLLLLRFAFLWVGVYLGLVLRGAGSVTAVQTLEFPIGFLSAAFVAPSTMPGWLGTVAEWNPLSATATVGRELFGNPVWGDQSWAGQHSGLLAIAWPLAIVAVFFPLSVRRYRDLSR